MNVPRLQLDNDGGGALWALGLLLLPVIGRIARAILEALGLVQPAQPEQEKKEPVPRRRQRAEEDEGRDLWERLARGELPETPAPRPVSAPPPPRTRPAEVSLESDLEPAPLSVLGAPHDAREPSEAPELSLERAALRESSLESAAEPEPLSALGTPVDSDAPALPFSARGFRLLRGDLGRAVLLSEILGPPLSQRAGR